MAKTREENREDEKRTYIKTRDYVSDGIIYNQDGNY